MRFPLILTGFVALLLLCLIAPETDAGCSGCGGGSNSTGGLRSRGGLFARLANRIDARRSARSQTAQSRQGYGYAVSYQTTRTATYVAPAAYAIVPATPVPATPVDPAGAIAPTPAGPKAAAPVKTSAVQYFTMPANCGCANGACANGACVNGSCSTGNFAYTTRRSR